jgi:hypothetical protein
MNIELRDWLNSINQTKNNLIDDDVSLEKEYNPYIINRCMSHHIDSIMYANEMNIYYSLPKKLQYDFYINSLRKRKRYADRVSKEKIQDLDYVKRYYGYSNEKAKQALRILTTEQLNYIKSKFETGGTK